MKILILLGVFLLTACTSKPDQETLPAQGVKGEFETAIADQIISEVIETLPSVGGAARSLFLEQKLAQFDRSVDLTLVSERIRIEHALLVFLNDSEDVRLNSGDFFARTNAQASLDWTAEQYAVRIEADLDRLAAEVADTAEASDKTTVSNDIVDLAAHMSGVRTNATYPEDSFEGRQQYMDSLADTMFESQADWFDLLHRYETSSLSLFGEESSSFMFRYNTGELTVNLSDTNNLPLFELKPLSVFYGFPGLEALKADQQTSLRSVLQIPGYQLGWASFIVASIGTLSEQDRLVYLYFELQLTALAWVDLRLNTDDMTGAEALAFLQTHTPYQTGRLNMLINEVKQVPGRYLAAAAGKLTFLSLQADCKAEKADCDAGFNQIAVERGAVPFNLLARRLNVQW